MLSRRAALITTTTRRTAAAAATGSSCSLSCIFASSSSALRAESIRNAGDAQRDILRDDVCQTLRPAQTRQLLERWTYRTTEYDAVTVLLLGVSTINVVAMFLIIFDWIYRGHVDLWDGIYGIDDDDDDDDDDE